MDFNYPCEDDKPPAAVPVPGNDISHIIAVQKFEQAAGAGSRSGMPAPFFAAT